MNNASEWIPVGALGDAFETENNCLPPVDDLAGKHLALHFENGTRIEYRFAAGRLQWSSDEGSGEAPYVATRPREGVYFVDFLRADVRAGSVSLVLDLNRNTCLGVFGQLPVAEESLTPFLTRISHGKELTAVSAQFLRGTVNLPFEQSSHLPCVTRDLLGKRVEYRYSPFERYEHIYLNDRYYTWRCIEGSEKGLADTDACHYYQLGEALYLFVWREKIVPTLGIVILDFNAMKTTGKILGYEDNDFGSLRNFSVGARIKLLSTIPAE